MKFDMGRAWEEATVLLGNNRDVVLIIAGVFLFLPLFAQTLLVPAVDQTGIDPTDAAAIMNASLEPFRNYWWAFLISGIIQAVGQLALLALLTDSGRPTVGEALQTGANRILPYIATQFLLIFGASIAIGLPLGLVVASQIIPLIVIIGLVALIAFIYLMVKFSLILPVIAVDKISSPVAILKRSWTLTKGNSVRLFGFYFLLVIAVGIISALIGGVAGVVFAAIGGQAQAIGVASVTSVINAVFAVLILAVLASIHRQLAGPAIEDVSDTFA